MAAVSDIVKKHFDAALAEGALNDHDAETVARSMFAFVMACYRETRDAEDIREELAYQMENLDPDQAYEFMRP